MSRTYNILIVIILILFSCSRNEQKSEKNENKSIDQVYMEKAQNFFEKKVEKDSLIESMIIVDILNKETIKEKNKDQSFSIKAQLLILNTELSLTKIKVEQEGTSHNILEKIQDEIDSLKRIQKNHSKTHTKEGKNKLIGTKVEFDVEIIEVESETPSRTHIDLYFDTENNLLEKWNFHVDYEYPFFKR